MSFHDSIKAAVKGQTIYDRGEKSSIAGLHVRMGSGGRGSYFLFYRTKANVQRRPKIGDFPTLSVTDAREVAKALLLDVAMGKDPSLDRKRARGELTVSRLFETVWARHWSKPRFRESGWAKEVLMNFENHIKPAFGSTPLSLVTPKLVREWHESKSETPVAANRSLEILSKMFTFAEEQEYRPQNTNPCALVKGHTEKKRKRVATPDEIRKVGEILKREEATSPKEVAYISTLIFTGARPKSLAKAKWTDIRSVTVDGKVYGVLSFTGKGTAESGEDEQLILPPNLMAIFDKLPKTTDLIFEEGFPRAFWEKVRKEAGCETLWARDWRRTFASLALSDGVSLSQIGELLNHKTAETTKRYADLVMDSKCQAASGVAGQLAALIGE